MNKPIKQQKHDEARDALINAIAYRRALRVLYDARNSTSIEQEVEDLLRENQPLSGMTDAQLVIEWEAFNPEEDPESDYVPPKLNGIPILRVDFGLFGQPPEFGRQG